MLTIDGAVDAPTTSAPRTASPLADLIEQARPRPEADHATVHAGGDAYRASIPLVDLCRGELTDGRLIIPGGRTLCWNVKDVVRIEVTVGPRPDSVPPEPPH
ncbi:MAG: Oxidoreductase molybdopterin binding domain [Actinomycetota bacterium]|nr:Oxidoreductase molybdopterin binding domain [Actinomycetota bacterium]